MRRSVTILSVILLFWTLASVGYTDPMRGDRWRTLPEGQQMSYLYGLIDQKELVFFVLADDIESQKRNIALFSTNQSTPRVQMGSSSTTAAT